MFNPDFYPTPAEVIQTMLLGEDITNKTILEPHGGKGNIVDYLLLNGAKSVISCENDDNLRKILTTKCKVIENDFLQLTSDKISHVDYIVMNPPFSSDDKHILHAYNIAPAGCRIIALCNANTIKNPYSKSREKLSSIIEDYGQHENLGECFTSSERKTNVDVELIKLTKPGNNYENEFSGFFLDEDPEEEQINGIMSYNLVRDLVNRYVGAIKIFDEQMDAAVKMCNLTSGFYSSDLSISINQEGVPKARNDFKKDLQKSGWNFIFDKMNMDKYATRSLKEDINKFVEQQENIPFTMKNIYHMLQIVIGTTSSRMDKAIIAVFDKLTMHYDENRFNVEGWKTNSHYLVNEKFIIDNMCYQDPRWYKGQSKIQTGYGSSFELIEDVVKAICYITGDNYEKFCDLKTTIEYKYKIYINGKYKTCEFHHNKIIERREEAFKKGEKMEVIDSEPQYGEWFDWSYFEVKAFKRGTMHFKFKDKKVWEAFNSRVAKIKGFPLYEATKKQKTEQKQRESATVLATFQL